MTSAEADDLLELARDLEHRALGHEKNIHQLDLARARKLRDLAARIRLVVGVGRENAAPADAVHREAVSLRLEAMVVLLSEPAAAPPPVTDSSREVPRKAAAGEVVPIARIRKKI